MITQRKLDDSARNPGPLKPFDRTWNPFHSNEDHNNDGMERDRRGASILADLTQFDQIGSDFSIHFLNFLDISVEACGDPGACGWWLGSCMPWEQCWRQQSDA